MATAPTRRALFLSLALGLIAPDGFAPLELWPLTLVCIGGLILLVEDAGSLLRAFAIGWWFGVGFFCVGLNWIATAFTFQAAMPAWLGWIAVFLLSLYLAVFTGIATGLGWWLWRKTPAGRLRLSLILAGSWTLSEYLRATAFTGFAWNPIAAIWAPVPGLAPTALPWIGTYGLSGLTFLLVGAVVSLWPRVASLIEPKFRLAGSVVGTAIGAAALAAFAYAYQPVFPGMPSGPLIRIVQPNIPQDKKWESGAAGDNFARIARMTGSPEPEPRLILWPEVAVPWYIEEDAEARAAIADLLGPRDLLLLGAVSVRYDRAGNPIAASNSLYGMDQRGKLLGRYDKSHLVPYGEYLPMRPILSAIGLSRLAPGDMDFDSGPGPGNVPLPGLGPVGVQICYEMTFSGQVVDRAHRPRFLFNPSNDAWFGSWGPPQHLAQARLRAMEEGLPVIRATPTGISALIDAHGHLLSSLPWHTAGVIEGRLPPALPPTAFARYGNILPLAFAGLLAASGFARRRRRG